MKRSLTPFSVFATLIGYSVFARGDESKPISKGFRDYREIHHVVVGFAQADEAGDEDKLYALLSKRWRTKVVSPEQLKSMFAARLAFRNANSIFIKNVDIRTINGVRVARVVIVNRAGEGEAEKEGGNIVGTYFLCMEGGEWKLLFASPSRLQPLFDDLVFEGIDGMKLDKE